MRKVQDVVQTIARSPFRRKFKLSASERADLRELGIDRLLAHAHALVEERLAPARPEDDGRQTPFRGNPVFVAQHGTATCCRRCLEKWHKIPCGRALSSAEQDYIVSIIGCWLRASIRRPPAVLNLPAAAT
ncbi:MAG: DUF4186 domain-containing protein [Herminiimonas sp.]|nr:DUF4186 domain-containing protein [Herminiimonas sp.]